MPRCRRFVPTSSSTARRGRRSTHCESDPARAIAHNGLAVRWLAEGCEHAGARLVQISTDYVFDGLLDRPYNESDEPSPRACTGESKFVGETEALALGTAATIVRTSWVCSQNGSNMVKTIMRLAAERAELAFVDDQIGHPTFTSDLAPMVRRLAVDRRSGIHHVTNQTSTSWYGFAREVVAAMGKDPGHGAPDHDGRAAAATTRAASGQQRARQHGATSGRHPVAPRLHRTAPRDGRGAHALTSTNGSPSTSSRSVRPRPGASACGRNSEPSRGDGPST